MRDDIRYPRLCDQFLANAQDLTRQVPGRLWGERNNVGPDTAEGDLLLENVKSHQIYLFRNMILALGQVCLAGAGLIVPEKMAYGLWSRVSRMTERRADLCAGDLRRFFTAAKILDAMPADLKTVEAANYMQARNHRTIASLIRCAL